MHMQAISNRIRCRKTKEKESDCKNKGENEAFPMMSEDRSDSVVYVMYGGRRAVQSRSE